MMIPVTDDDITAMDARANAATPGPWVPDVKIYFNGAATDYLVVSKDAEIFISDEENAQANAAFIAACRQFVPAIIARQRADAERIARLEAQIKKLRSALEPLIRHAGTAAFHSKEMCPVMLSDVRDAAAVLEETAPASNDRGVR